MFLDLRIVNGSRASFSQVRILKGLPLKRPLVVGRYGSCPVWQAFELVVLITHTMIAYW